MIQIFNRDALHIIESLDSPQSFFYLDPPYPEADQGPYIGYSNNDFNNLTNKLKNIKGHFLLSCYKKEWMDFSNTWKVYKLKTRVTASKNNDSIRYEYLIKNY